MFAHPHNIQNSHEKSKTSPILSFIRKLNIPCRTCSLLRYSWSAPILRSCRPSDRLDFTSLILTKVSCTDECSRPSASCILLCRAFIGPRNRITRASPSAPPASIRMTKCQSIAIRIPAAPTKLTTIPIRLGRILMMPFLITLISEKTLFTSSPL